MKTLVVVVWAAVMVYLVAWSIYGMNEASAKDEVSSQRTPVKTLPLLVRSSCWLRPDSRGDTDRYPIYRCDITFSNPKSGRVTGTAVLDSDKTYYNYNFVQCENGSLGGIEFTDKGNLESCAFKYVLEPHEEITTVMYVNATFEHPPEPVLGVNK